ncbi:arf-GAP domain and FG repeat-containing 1 isoform X5 [Pelobates cultripes]|uniref:Arf-GAP domain and FG repeat-containing 1 isoform X5 n=1 Tax=Pelobates cultripes TaxID=61616 RepID=A0AAD1RAS0_PELCU|nr:arf-GAP domain and FG repeat-containing 1 isoform X5 [Pelobates cultripes]
MAASAKRKQEEKHLKLLREMTSLPHNRKCFDCDQRGPTYANMTAGAFVCTSCSGILRGLNPPHRVKSISMTTFTQQEIEFLQKHGNDACKQIWLGLFDDRSSSVPDFRDPQKMKEFLQEKYEKKRWYVPPEQARVVASVHASISGSSASSASSTPEVKPLKTLLGDSAPTLQLNKGTPSQSPVVSRNQPQQQHHQPLEKKPFDLLGDLGADIFATPAPQSAATANFANFANFNSHAGANANANFAQFDNFPKSSSADFGAFNSNAHSSVTSKTAGSKQSHPTADKYAALADLDSVLSSSQGGGQGSAYGSSTGPASSTQAVPAPTDNVFGIGSAMPAGRTHQPASAPGVFGVSASTNPFVSQSVGSAVNPFQSNGRVPQGVRDGHPAEMDYQGTPFHPFHPNRLPTAAGAVDVSSLSMPAGFGTQTAYSLPTSFSGSFHQPAFPAQTAFPQQTAFSQQPNGNIQGGGFAVFGQAKPMVTPFGQVAAPGVSSNPFMAGAPSGQFPAGSSSTNPFL